VGRVGLDLAAQPCDAHIDHAVEGRALVTLEQIDQRIAAEHSVRMFKQDLEQGKLGPDTRSRAVARHAPRFEIDLEGGRSGAGVLFPQRVADDAELPPRVPAARGG